MKQALGTDIGSLVAASTRLAGFLSLIVIFTPILFVHNILKPNNPFYFPHRFHRLLIRLLGFNVRVHGIIATAPPVLFVSNHSSYLDIPVLGALIPAAFVAKAEVASWPLFGYMARLQKTVFIERRAARAQEHKDGMQARLAKGDNLILFPEGTSSDGLCVLPFRSSLFAAVENQSAVTVQPISIACTELDGLPITRAFRPYYAWFGDMTLVGHLWTVFKLGRFTVDVVFHPELSPTAFPGRKELANYCHRQVAKGIEQCLAGRKAFAQTAPKLAAAPAAAPASAAE